MESNQKKEKHSRQSTTTAELILHKQNSRMRLEKEFCKRLSGRVVRNTLYACY